MKSVSFIVTGSTVTRNGFKDRDLARNVNTELNKILHDVDSCNVIDVKINVELQGPSGDFAFVTVLLKQDKKIEGKEPIKSESTGVKKYVNPALKKKK